MIAFQNVYKVYNSHSTALEDVNLRVNPGEFVCLVGRSGAGKSTIIKLLIGEERPTRGRVFFGQYEVSKLRDKELPTLRRHIGIVFQDFRLLANKSSYENVAFALEVAGRPQREIDDLVPQVLDMVGLGEKMKNLPHELSGGEKQRVAIARALINDPSVIFADEPTGNLDSQSGLQIMQILQQLNERGKTIILVTHEQLTAEFARRIVKLHDGRVTDDSANINHRRAEGLSQLK